MSFLCRMKVRIRANVNLNAAASEPCASALREFGRFRHLLQAKHVIDVDRAIPIGIGEAMAFGIELGMRLGHLQPQRIKPSLQMAAHAIGADDHQRTY